MVEFLEELISWFVAAAATLVVLMILAFVGTVAVNISVSVGWLVLIGVALAAAILIWRLPAPMKDLADQRRN